MGSQQGRLYDSHDFPSHVPHDAAQTICPAVARISTHEHPDASPDLQAQPLGTGLRGTTNPDDFAREVRLPAVGRNAGAALDVRPTAPTAEPPPSLPPVAATTVLADAPANGDLGATTVVDASALRTLRHRIRLLPNRNDPRRQTTERAPGPPSVFTSVK